MPITDNRFPKTYRLYLRKEIESLFIDGKIIQDLPIRSIYKILPAEITSFQAGVVVSKKNFKKAVDRNRIKRQMREVIRLNCRAVCEHFIKNNATLKVMFVFTGKTSPEYATLESKIILILQRLVKAHERTAE